jgi:DNA modification methylase
LSKTPNPKADNRKILKPYSQSMKQLLKNGYKAKIRPSRHDISDKFQKDNQGAILPNLVEIANTENLIALVYDAAKQQKSDPIQRVFLKGSPSSSSNYLTDEVDIVLDPFAGSNTTGFVAETLQRRWISFEINENYVMESRYRFS